MPPQTIPPHQILNLNYVIEAKKYSSNDWRLCFLGGRSGLHPQYSLGPGALLRMTSTTDQEVTPSYHWCNSKQKPCDNTIISSPVPFVLNISLHKQFLGLKYLQISN